MSGRKSLNRVTLIGNLTRDPMIKTTPSGASVCTFTLATNSAYKKPDGNYEELTEFHNIVAWTKLAEICGSMLKKGMKVYVEGELRTRRWDDEEGGKKMQRTEVRIVDMIIMNPKSSNEKDDENEDFRHSEYSDNLSDEDAQKIAEDLSF